jgi:glycerol-3-phosphate cytidylyltransferase
MIIGFTCGAFDLLHAGHIAMLKECKEHCEYLIVGLHTDPTIDRPTTKNKPVQSIYERYLQLKGCEYVDDIIPYDTEQDLENLLCIEDISIRFLGEEYNNSGIDITGESICNERNITIYFTSRKHGESICNERNITIYFTSRKHTFSSSELRNRINESHQ